MQHPALARVIVVDNASSDGTPDMVERDFPWVSLYRAHDNLGPCVARNAAAAAAEEPVLWFLDSDTEVLGQDGAARLYAALTADYGTVAAGGEAILGIGGHVIGVKRLRISPSAVIQGDLVIGSDPERSDCRVIASCNLMVLRRDFLKSGGFDPFYFFFYEDMDLTYRLHAAGGRLVALSPMPILHHYSEAVRIRRVWLEARNRMYFCLKNFSLGQIALLPLYDLAFLVRVDNFRRLVRRSRRSGAAANLVTLSTGPACGGQKAALLRAGMLGFRFAVLIALGYVALPVVLRSALAARFGGEARAPEATIAGLCNGQLVTSPGQA